MEDQEKTRDELLQKIKEMKQEIDALKFQLSNGISPSQQTEKSLLQSHQLLINLARLVPGVIYQYRLYPDGRSAFPYSSPGMYDIYEVTPEEVKEDATPVFGRLHPDDSHHVSDLILESARTLQTFYCEYRVVLPSQGIRWRWSQAFPERTEDGGTLWHGIISDVTERKRSEELLKVTLSELNKSQRIAQIGNWKLDLTTQIFTASEEALSLYGFPSGYFPNFKEVSECFHPEDKERVSEMLRISLQTKERYSIEARIFKRDTGELRYLLSIGEVQCDVDGVPISIIGTNQDITQRKIVEDSKLESEEKLQQKNEELNERNIFIQTILDQLPIGLALNNINEGRAIYMNRKFEEIYGWRSDEITSISTFFEKIYPDKAYRNQLIEKIMADINSGDSESMHWENIFVTRKDGSQRIVNAVNIPLNSQNTMVSTVMDISSLYQIQQDLVKAKEKAEESDHLKRAFLNNISHEIRTPFNGILGFLSLLQYDDLTAEERAEYIDIVNQSAYRLMNTVNEIVEISQIHAGQLPVLSSEIVLQSIIEGLFVSYKVESELKSLEFRILNHLPIQLKSITTDPTKLRGILSNLINNAIKFTQAGSIELRIEKDGNYLQFSVSDTGIGIPKGKQQAIFERFIQVDVSNTRQFDGSGLGLSIAKESVEMLGGSIWVESELGRGSVFYFTLPYQEPAEGKTPIEEMPTSQVTENSIKNEGLGLKILIVEDDEGSAKLIEIAVRTFGREVLTARTGIEAIEACHVHRDIDLVLMDIKMAEMNGYEATRQIRQFNTEVVIIAQTAYALAGDHDKAIASGCDDYIAKPIKRSQLVEMLRKYFSEAQIVN